MTSIADERWTYSICGLVVTANHPIMDLPTSTEPRPADVVISFGRDVEPLGPDSIGVRLFASGGQAGNGTPFLQVWRHESSSEQHLRFEYTNGTGVARFTVNRSGSRVDVRRDAAIPADDLHAYLLGPGMGCLQRLRGTTVLHAGVLAINDRAVLLIGPKGSGKSTLMTAFARRGVPVVADDQAPLAELDDAEGWSVRSGYPRLRVRHDTARIVAGLAPDSLKRVLSIEEKWYLPLWPGERSAAWTFRSGTLRLGAIYQLGVRRVGGDIALRSLPPAEAFVALTADTYAPYLLDTIEQTKDFELLGQIASNIAVRHVQRSDDIDSVPALCELILSDFESRPG